MWRKKFVCQFCFKSAAVYFVTGNSCILGLCAANFARANDTSFAAIEIDSINTNAKVGTEMTFKGDDAKKVMYLLPRINTTAGPQYEEHNRSLAIRSPGYEIVLYCSDRNFDRPNSPVAVTPKCTITFDKKFEDALTFPFEPERQCR